MDQAAGLTLSNLGAQNQGAVIGAITHHNLAASGHAEHASRAWRRGCGEFPGHERRDNSMQSDRRGGYPAGSYSITLISDVSEGWFTRRQRSLRHHGNIPGLRNSVRSVAAGR
jgi:hypothetical protein